LVLVGKYGEFTKKELEKLAKEKKVKVLFLGPIDMKDLIKLYTLAKVTVLTCPKEWFGLVPIEAMACGCPVVSWKDDFGPQESIREGKSGFLAKPYDVKDLAKNIQLALDKKWNKKEIVNSVKRFSEEEQEKVLLKKVRKFI
jgi:glycosyltransferase involved in cell wall biosynthesis